MDTTETTYMKLARVLGLPTRFEQFETMSEIEHAVIMAYFAGWKDELNIINKKRPTPGDYY